jgi:hypothetical protein
MNIVVSLCFETANIKVLLLATGHLDCMAVSHAGILLRMD